MVIWIEGQNATGKTIYVKKLLGATFKRKGVVPLKILSNPLDIENDFPERLIPSDFVFYYNIILPKHITFNIKNTQIYIFLEKMRGNARERNKIFRLYEKSIEQIDGIREREQGIKELNDRIESRHEQYHIDYYQWETTKKELEEKIKRIDAISAEINKFFLVPQFKRHHELFNNYIKSKYTEKQPENVCEALWDKVKRYEELHEQIIGSMRKKEESLIAEKESIGSWYELTKKLQENEKNRPGIPFTTPMTYKLSTLKSNLIRYKKKLITKYDIFELIKNFSSHKSIWINGKPSSDFIDFYGLIELATTLSPEELFISHCGNKIWFQQAFKTPYHTNGEDLTLDLSNFEKVYIEAPSMDEKVTVTND